MPYTTQVLDAAIQTVNALHAQAPFDFGLSLGDAANSTSYNELRWYIDVIDGQCDHAELGRPSRGQHGRLPEAVPGGGARQGRSPSTRRSATTITSIIGSFPVYADPSLGLAEAYVAGAVWATPDVLVPWPPNFPRIRQHGQPPEPGASGASGPVLPGRDRRRLADRRDHRRGTGRIGSTPARRRSRPIPPAAPSSRRSGSQEFFHTTSNPVGHGFALRRPGPAGGLRLLQLPAEPGRAAQGDRPRRHPVGDRRLEGHPRARVPRREPLGLAPAGARRRTGREPAR